LDSLFLANLSSPPLLFFFLGAAAAFLRSDLEIPTQVAKFLSLYLLFAIGFKGGVALAESSLDAAVWQALLSAVALSAIVPLIVFVLLSRRLPAADAAAVAATYGSISAVTFVTCTAYLDTSGIAWSGYLVAAMALMESPAIIVGILLYRLKTQTQTRTALAATAAGAAAPSVPTNAYGEPDGISWRELLRESCLNGSVFLIVGSMIIGALTGSRGMAQVHSFVGELFIGMLCLFLLDMGIVAARRLQELRSTRTRREAPLPLGRLMTYAVVFPLGNAVLAGTLALLLNMSEGDALLLTILGASASYIAVPAALRLALPEASPSIYLPMSLAITFPFNLLVGIPLYHQVLRWVLNT
jgi:hypothetical protein